MDFCPARRQSTRNRRKVLDRNWHTVQGTNDSACTGTTDSNSAFGNVMMKYMNASP